MPIQSLLSKLEMMTESETQIQLLSGEEYTYHAKEDQPLSEAVILAVATALGRETITTKYSGTQKALDPLYETIEPDALDSLFQNSKEAGSMVGMVEFQYCGCKVTVQSTGLVIVTKK